MSQVKRFIMPLEAVPQDGHHVLCDFVLEIPIGSYAIGQDSYWTLLLRSLAQNRLTTAQHEDLVSLRSGRQGELKF